MSNLFDEYSDEVLAGWFNRVSSKERWEIEKEDFCNFFQDECCEASFNEECPQVIAEFNLDEKHFN